MRFPDYDIVMMALPRWDGPYSSTAFSLAKALSAHTRVFYVDNPITIKDYIIHRKVAGYQRRRRALFRGADFVTFPEQSCPNLFAVTPRVTLPINWLPEGSVYNFFARLNDRAVSSTLNQLIGTFGIKRYVLINSFNPLYGKYLSLLIQPILNIYQCVDNMTQAPYMRKHGPRLEDEFVAKSDFTIVTSSELRRAKLRYSPNVYLVPNAADVGLFNRAVTDELPVPSEIRAIGQGRRILIYTGNICQRLDYELIRKVATAHSDKVILMVGPVSGPYYDRSGLRSLPNVVLAGKKKIEELPAYLRHSDCCIIPFLCNAFTQSIYPLKINEYLSAGKPVVSTAFSEDICAFSDVASVCQTKEEFVSAIDVALETDNEVERSVRVNVASHNNWSARAHQFIDLTSEYLNPRDGRRGEHRRRQGIQALYG